MNEERMEWNGNYNVNYDGRNRSVLVRKVEYPFQDFGKGTNVLLYLDRDKFKARGLDKSLAYGLSKVGDFNVAVATQSNLDSARDAQIVISRLYDDFENELGRVYGDSKLIVDKRVVERINSDDYFRKIFVPELIKGLNSIESKFEAGA